MNCLKMKDLRVGAMRGLEGGWGGVVEVQFHSLLISALDGGEFSIRASVFNPVDELLYQLIKSLCGRQSGSEVARKGVKARISRCIA
jgi:hypothetical protein